MIGRDFVSANKVLVLPSTANPKVYLAIDSAKSARLSFKLYNPFSLKGKVFKWVVEKLCVYSNSLASFILPTLRNNSSLFISHLAKELGAVFTSSVYLATARDKIVLQLVSNGEIYGYLKYPISAKGKERLFNEQKAIEILSKKSLVSALVYKGTFKQIPFIILKNIEGNIGKVDTIEYSKVLRSFHKKSSYSLKEHPRIISIEHQLRTANLLEKANLLVELVETSVIKYKEVYEHGDFAAWNLIRTDKGLVPFDFEYFIVEGLEYFDELKFHFQNEYLLQAKNSLKLINAVAKNIKMKEFEIVFQLFLLKEILLKQTEGHSTALEESLLKILAKKNT